ncbi:hypothetical protein X975_15253, partial [Stegodyphus mimosarum]
MNISLCQRHSSRQRQISFVRKCSHVFKHSLRSLCCSSVNFKRSNG